MDKETYETYEYLPTGNAEAGDEQFFLVQDDGTFLINRQLQLDGVQGCTVYDVTQQQFLVDVDNSTELISVPDNFILPSNGENLYGNNYLLQAVPNTNTQAEGEATDNQFNQTEPQDADITDANKKSSNCTEITLSDDQYKMLEEKGWILLETNEKVFILDTLGLHDITTNQELIQQLKSESKCNTTSVIDSSLSKLQEPPTIKFDSDATLNSSDQPDTIDYATQNLITQDEDKISDIPIILNKEQDTPTSILETESKDEIILETSPTELKPAESNDAPEELQPKKNRKIMRIKTKFTFKDIPDKIVLGKTKNGKNLVARLKRPVSGVVKTGNNHVKLDLIPLELPKLAKAPTNPQSVLKEQPKYTGLFAWQFEKLIMKVVHEGSSSSCSEEQVASAAEIIEQLLQIPQFYPTLIETNIVVTKTVKNEMEENSNVIKPSVVTGRVTSLSGRLRFIHIPDLLQMLINGTVLSKRMVNGDSTATCTAAPHDTLLNVHITETTRPDASCASSITLNKRKLPKLIKDVLKRKAVVFACSSCATVFDTEQELTVHQVTHCMDFEDELTIDTDQMAEDENVKLNPYYIVKSNKGTLYACLHCSLKFNKLSNCLRHVKTHMKPTNHNKDASKELNVKKDAKVYKCKMCSSTYYHPSTLSKHIVTRHIRVNK